MAGLWCLGDQQYGCLGSLSPPGSRGREHLDPKIRSLNGKNTGKTGNIWEFDGFSMIFLLFSRRSQKKTDMTWKNWQKNGSGIQVADHFTIFFLDCLTSALKTTNGRPRWFESVDKQRSEKVCCRLLGAPTYRTRPRDVWKLPNFQFQASNTFAKRIKTTNCLVKVEAFPVYTYYILYHTISIVLYLYGNWSLIYIYMKNYTYYPQVDRT